MAKVIDKSTSTELDALVLSKGWLAVSAVAGKDDTYTALYHTVCIEQYDQGIRLIATDSFRLLVAWVPASDFLWEDEPDAGELPHATAVAVDQYGRARSLVAYLGQMAAKEENDGLTATVKLGVPWQPENTAVKDLQLDGFTALAVDLEYPGKERLQLPVYEGPFPSWRTVLTSFKPLRTGALGISQVSFTVLAKAAKPFGDHARLDLRFGGENKPVAVAFGQDPRVTGLVMPMRWDFETNSPVEPVEL